MDPRLTWKEKYSALVLLLVGLFFLISQVLDFASSTTSRFSFEEGKVSFKLNELKDDLKIYFVIFLAILGSLFLFKMKRIGWILGLPVLVWYCILTINGLVMAVYMQLFDPAFLLLSIGFLILILAIGFLYRKSAREKYKVGKSTYLPTFLILMAIVLMNFLL